MGNLVLHASTPAATYNGAASTTTASFTPPAGSLLVVTMLGNSPSGINPTSPSVTDSLTTHLTYTLKGWSSRADDLGADAQVAIWVAPTGLTAPGSMTVTVNIDPSNPGVALKVQVWTDDSGQAPDAGNFIKGGSTVGSNTFSQALNASVTGSRMTLGFADWNTQGTPTAGTGCTVAAVAGGIAATQGTTLSYCVDLRSANDGVSGSPTTVSGTCGTTTTKRWAMLEVVPAAGAAPPQLGGTSWPAPGVWPQSMRGPFPYLNFTPDPRGFDDSVAPQLADVVGDGSFGIAASVDVTKVAAVSALSSLGASALVATQKIAARSGLSTVGAATVATTKKVAPVPGLSTMGLASTVASRKVAPKTAQAFAGVAATVTGKKVSVDAALSALGVATTAIRVPATAVVARMAMGLASAATIKKVAADTALSTLGAAATVASRKVAPQTGRAALGLAQRASVVKVSTPAARAFTGLQVVAATVRRALPNALAAIGVESFALRAQGTLVTARSAFGVMARAAVAKTAAPTGAALVGLRQTVTAKHIGNLSGQSALGVTGKAAAVKRSISAARLLYGLTTLGTGRRVALPTARTYVGLWTGIDLSAITARDIELILGTPEFHWNIGAAAPAWSTGDIQAKWRIITDLAIRWDADELELKWHSGSAQL